MKIITKYNLHEDVYIAIGDNVKIGNIVEIIIEASVMGTKIMYEVIADGEHHIRIEQNLHKLEYK